MSKVLAAQDLFSAPQRTELSEQEDIILAETLVRPKWQANKPDS